MCRDFNGIWVPRHIWLDSKLTIIEKMILMEIDSLDMSEKGCYATNGYFSEFMGVSISTISRAIKKLSEMKYIKIKNEICEKGTKRTIKSLIKMTRPPNQNDETPLSKRLDPPSQNDERNNTLINKTINNRGTKAFAAPSIEEIKDYAKEKALNDYSEPFFYYYDSKGWMVGKQKMKNWKSAYSGWCARQKEYVEKPKLTKGQLAYIEFERQKEEERLEKERAGKERNS